MRDRPVRQLRKRRQPDHLLRRGLGGPRWRLDRRADRRLHARWRWPALVTECHLVLGPTALGVQGL